MKNSNEHLEKIRAACIEANPGRGVILTHNDDYLKISDVLIAIKNKYSGNLALRERFVRMIILSPTDAWNLADDNLSNQSPETLEFIASLL